MRWQLIVDGAIDGVSNMAIDSALLDEVESSSSPRTIVRFYGWIRPTVSLGRNQKVEKAVDADYCKAKGISIVHRPTGGRAVLHDDELTYAVISNDAAYFGDTIYGNYKRVSEALRLGYQRLGVPVVLASETRRTTTERAGPDLPCFVSTSRYELTVGGRKIVGSAQRRVRKSFLQHGSMLITCDCEALARVTKTDDLEDLNLQMAGMAEFLPSRPTIEELTGVFTRAFQDYFGIDFEVRNFD